MSAEPAGGRGFGLWPAVDLLGGRAVRLLRGSFAHVQDFGDPVEASLRLAAPGPAGLHLVDLDAARAGRPLQRSLVAEIVAAVSVPVQLGGGLRDESSVQEALEAGVRRVILGTAALEHPELVASLASAWPGRLAVGLDHRGAPGFELAGRAWLSRSGRALGATAREVEEAGVAALVVTAISTDGTLAGPDLEGLATCMAATVAVPVLASGGIARLEDLDSLLRLRVAGRRLAGAVVGRAFHDGSLGVGEAVQRCAASG